jgi:capsular polysaccharide transport system permease protein
MSTVIKRSRLKLWQDVIFALFIRQIRTKFNDKFGVAWLILQPVSFVVVMSMFRGNIDGDVHGIPTFVFMMLGFVTVLQFTQTWSSVSRSMQQDRPLYAFRQVQPISSILTIALIEITSNILVMFCLCIICLFLNINLGLYNPIFVLIYLFEIQLIAISLGVIFGITNFFIPEINKIESLLQRPLLFISGTFFTLEDMPEASWPYLTWNPLLHAIELARDASYLSFTKVEVISASFLHIVVLILLFLSLSIYAVFWKRAISR